MHNLTLLRDDSSDLLKIPVSSMPCGKFICITGPSGAGKSSLLLAMAGLNFKYTGMISYCADEPDVCTTATRSKTNAPDAPRKFSAYPLSTMTDKQLTRFRQKYIGFIFQQYRLINELSVLANAALSAYWIEKKHRSSIEERAASLLDELAISGTNKLCLSCSGGERQRIAAARALASNPDVLLADEPTASLDAANRDLLLDVMIDATINNNKTLIACSHDEAMIERADHVWHLDCGVLEPVR